jgi:hypothetical protein
MLVMARLLTLVELEASSPGKADVGEVPGRGKLKRGGEEVISKSEGGLRSKDMMAIKE